MASYNLFRSKSHAVLAAHLHSWKLVPESFHFQVPFDMLKSTLRGGDIRWFSQEPVPSSLVYGGIHLARQENNVNPLENINFMTNIHFIGDHHYHDQYHFRLLVKLPSILGKMKFTMMSAKNVHKYLELVENFVASQTDLFVEDSYK